VTPATLPSMTGRGGRSGGRGGRGNSGRGGRGRGRGQHYASAATASKRGLCTTLGTNVFDYSQKSAADQMRTSWEKLVQYVGTNYGQDISNELQNKLTVTLVEPVHTAEILTRHDARVRMVRTGQANIHQARIDQVTVLRQAVNEGLDPEAPMKLAILQNEIAQGVFAANVAVPVELSDSEKTQFNNEWRTHRERNTNLMKHRGQAFSLIQGQCTQLLQDKMKQDTDWNSVSTSYDPLTLYRLIEKTILAQTEDQYPFATVYDQDQGLYMFKQESLTNPQWYDRFNTKIDVSESIGVTRQHKVLCEYVAQELYTQAFADLGDAEQRIVRDDAEERYVSYVFLRQSGAQHANLRVDLQNDFTTGDNRYPKTRQATLHLLDKYSKTVVARTTQSEGTSFAQGSTRTGGNDRSRRSGTFDKAYWKNKECYKCHKKGHPASHCPGSDNNDDDQSVASVKSTASSVKKLQKELKGMKKSVATVNTQLAQLKEDEESNSSLSDVEEEHSHFQVESLLFAQAHGIQKDVDLKEVILLDSCSSTDIFCNKSLVGGKTWKSKTTLRL
jgi:hypothetical protein